ncbi:HipA family kinase [Halobacillus campisalis]|uniref:HipA family kinase n=1 Tax=Halobacillus campisalis TaxID=435909 RepID=A0ABW2K897_9BACI|nr:HipA family kinase [Halobacillus campisalis]
MLKAVKYVGAMSKGKTRPQLFECDDGQQYVVKFMSNPISPNANKLLVHEIIANRLAQRLSLPIAKGEVIYFSKEVIENSPQISEFKVKPGPHFGTIFYKNKARPTNMDRIKKCKNLQEMAGVMVFDHWVHNRDRSNNLWNLIIDEGEDENKLYMIDHAGCFYSSRRSKEKLRDRAPSINFHWGKTYKNFRPLLTQKTLFKHYVEKIEQFPDAEIKDIVFSTPGEWEPDPVELEAIYEYLTFRKAKVKEITDNLLDEKF